MKKLLATVAASTILLASAAFAAPETGAAESVDSAVTESAPAKADAAPAAKHSGKHHAKKHAGVKKAKKDAVAK